MVLRQIGEDSRPITNALHAPLLQGMGRNLHDRMRHSCLPHVGKVAMQIKSFRRRPAHGKHLASVPFLDRSDNSRLMAAISENLLDQVSRSRFPLVPVTPITRSPRLAWP